MKHMYFLSKSAFASYLVYIFCFLLLTINTNGQSQNAVNEKTSDDLKLTSIRTGSDLTTVLEDHLASINTSVQATDIHPYDKVLFTVYASMVNNIKNVVAAEGQNVIVHVFNKALKEELTKPQYKDINPADLKSLAYGLVELLQVPPQVSQATIE